MCNQAVRSIAEPGELLPDTLKRLVSEHQEARCDSPESNSDSEVAYIKMITNSPADSALVTYTPGAVVIPEPNQMQDDEDDSPRSPEPAAVIFSQRITDRTVPFDVTQVDRRDEIRPDESDLRRGWSFTNEFWENYTVRFRGWRGSI